MRVLLIILSSILMACLAYVGIGALTDVTDTVRLPLSALLGYVCFAFVRWLSKR